ncbi:TonB-dependent receptor [Pedobacter sp. Leaf250]|uniref:TonB-dependent receptor n=1 Tax=Pedobacter sp. Leaf250 TaxID=2876559 RepID=UPI001E585E70|nr:TonB-dependent receptor [Pedobacter sp. Leaf250]
MKSALFLFFALFTFQVFAQITPVDTVKKLNEVTVKGYYNTQPLLRSVSAVNTLDSNQLKYQQNSSLVSAFNSVTGVRMEERSPGSYRLSLRGSLLRSPFGIRNIKIYIDELPLTDAGGNTYLNAVDPLAIQSVEIYKGPEANIFGANTGGAILISSANVDQNNVEASLTAGSYGLFHQTAKIQRRFKNYNFSIFQGYQRSDGYRQNSQMNRKFIQTSHQLDYSKNGSLKFFAFYSDLNYSTPGGLTLQQMEQNPQLARPATATLPGAITQQAGIFNKTALAGLTNTYQINENFKHVISIFTSYTDFKNPFITNYEKRYESTLGLRTFLEYAHSKQNFRFNAQLGIENSSTKTQVKNFDNNAGETAALQAADWLKANQDFVFARINFDINRKLLIELASSINFFNYKYESFYPAPISMQKRKFANQLMPKIAASYLLSQALSLRASISKGYSPPTIAEVRSSDNNINNNLQAELGWNYEAGLRFNSKNNRFYANANIFQFDLQDAIVRRLNANDTEYFINAGGTKQQGVELESSIWVFKNSSFLISGIQVRSNYTYNRFRFKDFQNGNTNFSGNRLTGVPANVLLSSLLVEFKKGLYFFAQHNYTSAIPLNDSNAAFAGKYNVVELKSGITKVKIGKINADFFTGINNVFNERYSLGNDLNAVGNRFYNPAAAINFYFGTSIKL